LQRGPGEQRAERARDREDPVEGNRREQVVALTPAGRQIVNAVTKRRRREIARIVSRIPEREQRVLVRALAIFTDAAGEIPEPAWSFGWDR